jgi:hypothetical protein
MTTRRDFLKMAGLSTAAAAIGVPVVAEAAAKRTYTNALIQGAWVDMHWQQALGRTFRNTYIAQAFGTGTAYDANGDKIDHVPLESVRKVAELMGEYFRDGYPLTHGFVGMPVYLDARSDTDPVAYITNVCLSENREVKLDMLRSVRGIDRESMKRDDPKLIAGPMSAELNVTIVSKRDDLDSGEWFIGPNLHYPDEMAGETEFHTPPPESVTSWGLFKGGMRWRSEPLRRKQSYVIKAVGPTHPDAVLPSGAPLGKLIGKEATVLGPSRKYNSSVLVSVDGMVYDIHDEHLTRV